MAPASVAEDPGAGRVLALDLGAVRVGVALSDTSRRVALARDVLDARDRPALFVALRGLCESDQVALVVVGVPLGLDGRAHDAAQRAQEMIEELRAQLVVPVIGVDERRSTLEADALRLEAVRVRDAARRGGRGGRAGTSRKGARRPVLDADAAARFLQSYLDAREGADDA